MRINVLCRDNLPLSAYIVSERITSVYFLLWFHNVIIIFDNVSHVCLCLHVLKWDTMADVWTPRRENEYLPIHFHGDSVSLASANANLPIFRSAIKLILLYSSNSRTWMPTNAELILSAFQGKLRFSKAQLHSLSFKLFDATFMTSVGMNEWLTGLLLQSGLVLYWVIEGSRVWILWT
jgi:hypothetical protein